MNQKITLNNILKITMALAFLVISFSVFYYFVIFVPTKEMAELELQEEQQRQKQLTEEQIHDGIIRKYLYQGQLPDPDIIVRTGGEQRLSNFLLWQSAYSELIFLKKYWPDFEEMDVINVLDEYDKRERRYGQ